LVLVLFDLLFLNGEELTAEALRVRKERLQELLARRRGQMGFRVGVRRDSRLLFAESGFDSRSVDGCGVGGLRAFLDSTG
jgi:ATP-dependent DNA ligase